MKSTDQAYGDDLLLALRLREVPGTRIGEVLAEVQSHVAETGEDPRQAFGDPKQYADEVAAAIGLQPGRGWRQLISGLTWRDVVTTVALGVAAFFLADGLWALGAGEPSGLGAPAWAVCVVAALVLAGCIARVAVHARREASDDEVVDPRTGVNMVPIRRWQVAVLIGAPLVGLALMVVAGSLTR